MEAARVADSGDLARMADLAGAAIEEALPRRGGTALAGRWATASRQDRLDQLTSALSDPATRMWVGTIDQVAVGVILAEAHSGGAGRIPLMYVEPDARGVGVGEAMLDEATVWLAEQGCMTIDVDVLPGDRDTKQFFEAAGMVARLLVMSRSL